MRLRGLLVAVPCLAAIALSAWLDPHAAGFGTHQQLGVPPCSFLVRTGWPCPSCGMTTSVALMARGRVIQAAKVQPFGVMLFSALAVASAVGLYELAGGKSLVHRLRPGLWWVWLGLGGMLVGWGIKAGVGHLAGRYPLP